MMMVWGAVFSNFFIQARSKPIWPTLMYMALRVSSIICRVLGSYISGLLPAGTMVCTLNLLPAICSVKYLSGSMLTTTVRVSSLLPMPQALTSSVQAMSNDRYIVFIVSLYQYFYPIYYE